MPAFRRPRFRRRRLRVTRARLRLRGLTAATFRRLERRLRRGFTAATVLRRRDRRRVALRLRRFATLILLVLYLIFVITRTLLRLLRRGLARATFRRRELLRLRLGLAFDTFINWPLAFRLRPLRLLRRRLRAFAIVFLLGFAPISARCGLRLFRFTVFFFLRGLPVSDFITELETFEAISPASKSVRMF